jgi:hypothetical protein
MNRRAKQKMTQMRFLRTLFGRLAELAEYIDGDAIDEPVDRCPSKVQ